MDRKTLVIFKPGTGENLIHHEGDKTQEVTDSFVLSKAVMLTVLVPEMPHPGENHRQAQPVCRLDYFLIAH